MTMSRTTITAGVAALSLAVSAAPAFAKGGGDINNTVVSSTTTTAATPPPPMPENLWDLCGDYFNSVTLGDGSYTFSNVTTGGCLVAKVSPSGALGLYKALPATGWTYSVKTSDPSKVQVDFTNPYDGETHSIRVEPGKTVIR